MNDDNVLSGRAEELRSAFDRAFAVSAELVVVETLDFLLLRLGTVGHAVRLSEIAGLFVDRAITKLPGSPPELLGLSGFRGAVLPVYDVSAVLGHGPADKARWMVMLSGAPMALAFDDMLGHRRIAVSDIRRGTSAERSRADTREFVPADDGQGQYEIVGLQAVIARIIRKRESQ
jgi:purine-binding chemotaxis protein CheW